MDTGFVILTEAELEDICGQFFDKGYYSILYQTDTTDNSISIFTNCKDGLLKNIKRSDGKMTQLYNEMLERLKYLETQEQTNEIKYRLAEINLSIVRVQQLLLKDIN